MASLTLDWIQLAAALGAFQGVLLVFALLAQRRNRTANRVLAVVMATFTIYLAQGVYYATGMIYGFPHLFGIASLGPWVFGPLVYLYAIAASDRAWRFRRRDLVHFIPFAIMLALSLPIFALSGAGKIALFEGLVNGTVSKPHPWLDPFKYVSGIGYSAATILYLRRHRRRVLDSYSNMAHVNLSWLLWLTAGAALIWVMVTALRVTGVDQGLRDQHVSLAIALLVYAIGYVGLRQPEIFRYETAEWPIPAGIAAVATRDVSPNAAPARYERSSLDDAQANKLAELLGAVMDREQPWKDSDLTLAQLAMLLDSTPHKVSEVLNSRVGQTFYDFVNGFRVRDVQRRIQAGEARTRKMLALAMDAGFASKSTFNDAFKKHTSQTPSAFRESVGA